MNKKRRIVIVVKNPEACTGCLICELACSFHHIGKYSRSHSSIKVNKSIFDPQKGAQITISHTKKDAYLACDLCHGEEFPLCIRFCPENVLEFEGRQP